MLDNFFIRGCNSRAHPVGCIHIAAECIRITIFTMLCLSCNVFPHIPGLSGTILYLTQIRCMRLIAIAGGIGTAAIGNKYQIVFNQIYRLFLSVFYIYDLLCNLLISNGINDDIFDIHTIFNGYAMCFQIFNQRKNHALVLVIFGKTECTEIRKSVNMMNITAKITLHFQSTGPTLECEHRLPVKPEVGLPEGIRQHIRNLLSFQILLRCDKQLGKCHCGFLIQLKLLIGVGILTTVYGCSAKGIVRIMLV